MLLSGRGAMEQKTQMCVGGTVTEWVGGNGGGGILGGDCGRLRFGIFSQW